MQAPQRMQRSISSNSVPRKVAAVIQQHHMETRPAHRRSPARFGPVERSHRLDFLACRRARQEAQQRHRIGGGRDDLSIDASTTWMRLAASASDRRCPRW